MTTLEQAAKAAAERAGYYWDKLKVTDPTNYPCASQDWWIDNQRAAFERVREPSEGRRLVIFGKSGITLPRWKAAIDAILTEGKT